jgi:hypothetical protein
VAVPSSTMLQGRYALRCANVNHRSRREDFETLVAAVVSIGQRVQAEYMEGDHASSFSGAP